MSIFNSLGSNYNLSYILKSLGSAKQKGQENLKQFLEKKYGGRVIFFYKGREALTAALHILDLPSNSEIAINGFTCVAVFNAIRKAGLEPACLDLDEKGGLNFTAKTLEEKIKSNKKIKAVVIQNTLGYPCNIKGIEKICKKNKLILIEDLAHCVGTIYEDGRETGMVGDMIVLSFSQDKIIDAVSGGALVVRNSKFIMINSSKTRGHNLKLQVKSQRFSRDRLYPVLTYKIRMLYLVELGKLYHFFLKRLGLMSKVMDESFYDFYALPAWNAHMALSEFIRLDKQLIHRKKIANSYAERLPDSLFMFDKKKTKEVVSLSSNLRFPVFVKNRAKLVSLLKSRGVYLSDIWYTDVAPECPNAVADSKTILNLPTHINVSEKDAVKICEIINSNI